MHLSVLELDYCPSTGKMLRAAKYISFFENCTTRHHLALLRNPAAHTLPMHTPNQTEAATSHESATFDLECHVLRYHVLLSIAVFPLVCSTPPFYPSINRSCPFTAIIASPSCRLALSRNNRSMYLPHRTTSSLVGNIHFSP